MRAAEFSRALIQSAIAAEAQRFDTHIELSSLGLKIRMGNQELRIQSIVTYDALIATRFNILPMHLRQMSNALEVEIAKPR